MCHSWLIRRVSSPVYVPRIKLRLSGFMVRGFNLLIHLTGPDINTLKENFAWWYIHFIPTLRRQKPVDICEFEASQGFHSETYLNANKLMKLVKRKFHNFSNLGLKIFPKGIV